VGEEVVPIGFSLFTSLLFSCYAYILVHKYLTWIHIVGTHHCAHLDYILGGVMRYMLNYILGDILVFFHFSYYLGGLLFIACLFIEFLFLVSGFIYVIPWEISMGSQNHGLINHH
jgi:hypothetical protein